MPTHIRTAGPSDLSAATRLYRRIISSQYRPFWGEQQVNEYIDNGEADAFIRKFSSKITIMTYKEHTGGIAIIDGNRLVLMIIEPSFPRMGLGTKLLAHCEEKMFAEHEQICLESYEGYDKANCFYRKHGWTRQEPTDSPEHEGRRLPFVKTR
jgi:GNAT superfamily N-acetyltransferase